MKDIHFFAFVEIKSKQDEHKRRKNDDELEQWHTLEVMNN